MDFSFILPCKRHLKVEGENDKMIQGSTVLTNHAVSIGLQGTWIFVS